MFLLGCFSFLLQSCKNLLHILDTSFFSDKEIANIFFISMACLSTFLNLCVQSAICNFMNTILSIFLVCNSLFYLRNICLTQCKKNFSRIICHLYKNSRLFFGSFFCSFERFAQLSTNIHTVLISAAS